MDYLLFGIVIALLVAVVVLLRRSGGKDDIAREFENFAQVREADRAALGFLQQQLGELTRQVDTKLSDSRRDMGELTTKMDARLSDSQREMNEAMRHQFSESQKLVGEIRDAMEKNISALAKEQQQANASVDKFAKFGEQLSNLERTLTHQKQRGAWGERSLELILDNFLVGNYEKQYAITDKDIVDFVIKTPEGLIPVDAKFSLDNYQRLMDAPEEARDALERDFRDDLKKRIDETAKYINEKKGTLSFAFMFIPAEAIYYDILMNKVGRVHEQSMIDYAYREKRVIIVSPTTFMAYLQTVLYGFKAFRVEKNAQDIIKRVGELDKHLKSYGDYHAKIGSTLGTLVGHYNNSVKQFRLVDKDVLHIAGESSGVELESLNRPTEEEE